MNSDSKIYVAGHRGMVGSAIVRELKRKGYNNLILRTHAELDLCRQDEVEQFFATERPEYVFLAAAKVGGIIANQTAPADFMYQNMMLEMNVIHAAWQNGCKRLEFLGSSCIYPRLAPQPMREDCLLISPLEPTNEAYALAKISGLKYCEYLNRQYGTDYLSVMPTNLYGPNDNDLAELALHLMEHYHGNETVNAGTGKEITIKELTETVARIVGYEGAVTWDTSRPNGTPRKLLDVSKATSLGWTAKTPLEEGIRLTYQDFLNNPMRAER